MALVLAEDFGGQFCSRAIGFFVFFVFIRAIHPEPERLVHVQFHAAREQVIEHIGGASERQADIILRERGDCGARSE